MSGVRVADAEPPALVLAPSSQTGLGWTVMAGPEGNEFCAFVRDPERMTLDFAHVPEPRPEPNRLHWDVVGNADELVGRGATHLWNMPRWTGPGGHRRQRVLRHPAFSISCMNACPQY